MLTLALLAINGTASLAALNPPSPTTSDPAPVRCRATYKLVGTPGPRGMIRSVRVEDPRCVKLSAPTKD